MVFNGSLVLQVADVSVDVWQDLSCIPLRERLSSQQLLDFVLSFPLQQLGRFALFLCTFLCLPPPDSFYTYSYSSSSDDDDDDDYEYDYVVHDHGSSSSPSTVDLDDYYYHSHSD